MADGTPVTLTELEVNICRFVAKQRQDDATAASARENKHGLRGGYEKSLDLHFEGCCGEMAFAKVTGKFWTGAGLHWQDDDDVAGVQVRVTHHLNGHLLIRPRDPDNDVWVLVVGSAPNFKVVGWCRGKDGKVEKYKKAPNGRPPAYFVPQFFLNDLSTLP